MNKENYTAATKIIHVILCFPFHYCYGNSSTEAVKIGFKIYCKCHGWPCWKDRYNIRTFLYKNFDTDIWLDSIYNFKGSPHFDFQANHNTPNINVSFFCHCCFLGFCLNYWSYKASNERGRWLLTLQHGHLKTAHLSYLWEYFLNGALILAAHNLN